MPGMRVNDNSYDYMTHMRLLRTVGAVDADLAAVPVLDLAVRDRAGNRGERLPVGQGASNRLILGALFGAGVTSATVQVYVDMYPTEALPEAADWPGRWVLVDEVALSSSGFIRLDGVYAGLVKVRVSAKAGGGNVYIVYSRTE
jgi:hypothetical protein